MTGADALSSDTSRGELERFGISNRDQALFLIGERDLDSQLIAIKGVLRRNLETEKQVGKDIKALEAEIRAYAGEDEEYQRHMENYWVDTLHGTVFQDAAHSMSAVGMLAPFIESMFVSIFQGLRARAQETLSDDPRSEATQDQYWNPQIAFGKSGVRDDLVAGIAQLANSTGLQPYLPTDYKKALSALFSYRNNMFHNGFEWPIDVRQKFTSRISNEGWSNHWFLWASRGKDPWICYMTDMFIAECLQLIDQVLEGVGIYLESAEQSKTDAI